MMSNDDVKTAAKRHSCRILAAALLPAFFFAGCTTVGEVGQRQTYVPPIATPGAPAQPGTSPFTPQPLLVQPVEPAPSFPATLEQSGANAAVVALYTQAQQEQASGSFDRAGNDFERAMRLAPRNAFIWDALAQLHLKMQQPEQAQSEAYKSISLARGNPHVLHASWLTVAAACDALGNSASAADARQQAQKYGQLTSVR